MLTDHGRLDRRPPLTGPRLRVPLAVLAGWTLFVWSNRILNVLNDEALGGFSRTWRLGVAVAFVGAALAIAVGSVLAWRSKADAPAAWVVAVGIVLSAISILWWPPRTISTLFGDFSIAFKLVHTVLAVTSVGVGVWVLARVPHSPFSRFLSRQG